MDKKARLVLDVERLLGEHIQTGVGWHKKAFATDMPGITIGLGGMFSLISGEDLRFVHIGDADAPFDRAKLEVVVDEQRKKGWKLFLHRDSGVKDNGGKYRFLPFVRLGFGLVDWLKKAIGVDFTGAFSIGKSVKIAKYFTQPIDFTRSVTVKVQVVDADLFFADGCGYAERDLFPDAGDVVKVVGIGDSAIFKGTILQRAPLKRVVPDSVLELCKGIDFDVLATTDTVKFSSPGLHEMTLFYHDDSSRNIHDKVTLSEQFVRVAPLAREFKSWFMNQLDRRHSLINEAMGDRGKKLGNFVRDAALDQDFMPGDSNLNAMIGDVGTMLKVGIPLAFKRVHANLMMSLQSFIRNRTISSIKHRGVFSYVIANQKLDKDTIILPAMMKKQGVRFGDMVTMWRSPISPTSVRVYRVAGFATDYHVEMRSEDLSEFHEGDTDGDKVAVSPGVLVNLKQEAERSKPDDAEVDKWIEVFRRVKSEHTKSMPEGGNVSMLINEIEITAISGAIGIAERGRAAIEIKHGSSSWKKALAFFREFDQALIEMKKHGGQRWDPVGTINSMIASVIPRRLNFHTLLGNRRSSVESIDRLLNNPQLGDSKHDFIGAYRKGVAMAADIVDGLRLTDRDRRDLVKFKGGVKVWLDKFLVSSKEGDFLRREIVGPEYRPAGALRVMYRRMGAFYHGVSGTVGEGNSRREFRAKEREIFAALSPDSRKAAIAVVLINEIYGWVMQFEMDDVRAVIDGIE